MINRKTDILKGSLAIFLFFISSSIFLLFLSALNINYTSLPPIVQRILNLIHRLILIIAIILIYRKTIIENIKEYMHNILAYLKQYFKYWILIIGLMSISNIIISFICNINTSTNQQQVMDTFHKFPIYTFILTVFTAPLLEELVFRLSFRKIFKNDALFIIISGFIFGLLHLNPTQNILELLYLIPYSIPGFVFAYTLVKSKNIFVPISLHFIHNALLMLVQILLLLIQ